MSDQLSDMLTAIRITRFSCRRLQMAAPWGMRADRSTDIRYCTVLGGQLLVEVPSTSQELMLRLGDTILFPHGAAHLMRDRSGSTITMRAGDEPEEGGFTPTPVIHRYGTGACVSDIVVGAYSTDRAGARPLLRFLPPVMFVPGDGTLPAAREALIAMRRTELQNFKPGSAGVLRHLAAMRFAQIVRHFVSQREREVLPGDAGEMSGALGPAIFAMHDAPGEKWTVDQLARLAGMSRSAFSSAFNDWIGQSPMRYLADIRMARAAELIATRDVPLGDTAADTGYSTSIAFTRAFKRHFGLTPGEYRRKRLVSGHPG